MLYSATWKEYVGTEFIGFETLLTHELSFGHMQLHQLLLEVERVNDHSKIHFFDRPQIPRIWQANVRLISRRIKSMSYKMKLGKYRDESEISLSCSCLGALKCMLANNVGMN